MVKSVPPASKVDGPAHYSYNTWKSIGGTVMKRRLLELQGWTVVPIPFFEWDMVLPWQRQVLVNPQRAMRCSGVAALSRL